MRKAVVTSLFLGKFENSSWHDSFATKCSIVLYFNFLLKIGDFDSEQSEPAISDFCEIYSTKNILKEKTSCKNPENMRPRKFQNSNVIETGFFDFHKMCVTMMKMCYCKQRLFKKTVNITLQKHALIKNITYEPTKHPSLLNR